MKCSHDTINNFINAAKLIKQNPTLAKFNPSIIFSLAKPSTPPELIEEAKQIAEADQSLSVADLKEMRQKALTTSKPQFKKGQFVEFFYIDSTVLGEIDAVFTKDLSYRIKKLHGPFYKGKISEKDLTLCPVQTRQNTYFDFHNIPQPGSKVLLKPIGSVLQTRSNEVFIVKANLNEGVMLQDEKGKNIFAHWTELDRPPVEEPKPSEVVVNTQVIDVETIETVEEEPQNEIPSLPETPLTIDLKKLGWSQKRQLLKELIKEMQLGSALPKSEIEEALDQLVERTIQELDENFGSSQRTREQFLIALVDKCL